MALIKSQAVNVRRLAYAYVSDAVNGDATVISRFDPDTPSKMPVVLVDALEPTSIANGRQELYAADCDVRVSCYAVDEDEAYDLALDVWSSVHHLWRSAHATEYGGISLIRRESIQPHRVESPLENDDSVCYQFVLMIIAQSKTSTP